MGRYTTVELLEGATPASIAIEAGALCYVIRAARGCLGGIWVPACPRPRWDQLDVAWAVGHRKITRRVGPG